eukprot:8978483-Pyramimonas_sp.AAC.1
MRVKGQGNEIEHLGLVCDPGNPSVQMAEVAVILRSLPGASDVRKHFAAAYVRPLWLWAVSLVEPTPRVFVGLLFRAIIMKSGGRYVCNYICLFSPSPGMKSSVVREPDAR